MCTEPGLILDQDMPEMPLISGVSNTYIMPLIYICASNGIVSEEIARDERLRRQMGHRWGWNGKLPLEIGEFKTVFIVQGISIRPFPGCENAEGQLEAEEVSNNRNKIHHTWERPYRDSL